MPHQLKPNDAVKCKSLEEWAEVIKLLALNEIVFNFNNYINLFEYSNIAVLTDDNIMFYDSLSYYLEDDSINYHSFQDFCAKIRGEYKEPEITLFFIDPVIYRDPDLKNAPLFAGLGIGGHDNMHLIKPGKYKLVRVEE